MSRMKDIAGIRFGKLTAEKYLYSKNRSSYWSCLCDCGKTHIAQLGNLSNGSTKQCSICTRHAIRVDLSGKTFNKLFVIEFAYLKQGVHWLCRCDCGNEIILTTSAIKSGRVQSCKKCPKELETGYNHLFNDYKMNAKRTKRRFELSKQSFLQIIKRNCWYCNSEPTHKKRNGAPVIANGIDRVDNDCGYTQSNCVPCCELCNRMKMALPEHSFLQHVFKIFRNQNNGDDYKTKTIHVTENNVGDRTKNILKNVFDMIDFDNLQKSEIKAILDNLVDEHVEEIDEFENKKV